MDGVPDPGSGPLVGLDEGADSPELGKLGPVEPETPAGTEELGPVGRDAVE